MNILQLSKYYDPVNGGIELVAKQVTKAFAQAGHKVTVVAFSDNNSIRTGKLGEEIVEVKEHLHFMSAPISFSFFLQFKKLILKNKINVIYVHLPNPFMHEIIKFYKKFLKKNNVKIIGIYHSDILNKKFIGTLYEKYFLASENDYDSFISSSKNLQLTSPVLSEIKADKVKVIPFCVEEINPFILRNHFSGKLLSIGRLVPYKGFEFLIDAVKGTDMSLTIVGGGPLYQKLNENLPANVKLLGDISDEEKNKLLKESDVLVVSSNSRAEAFGMTIVEAFQAGLPVLATQINTGVTFLVSHKQTGLTYPINDKQALLEQFEALSSNERLLGELSQGCFNFYNTNLKFQFFQEKIMGQLKSL
ncbi:MAG: glycosyltransferase [Rhizobacter sp.]|nr:glycosyltransferase [Bacteriovorax sp.]